MTSPQAPRCRHGRRRRRRRGDDAARRVLRSRRACSTTATRPERHRAIEVADIEPAGVRPRTSRCRPTTCARRSAGRRRCRHGRGRRCSATTTCAVLGHGHGDEPAVPQRRRRRAGLRAVGRGDARERVRRACRQRRRLRRRPGRRRTAGSSATRRPSCSSSSRAATSRSRRSTSRRPASCRRSPVLERDLRRPDGPLLVDDGHEWCSCAARRLRPSTRAPPVRRRRLGRLRVPVGAEDPRLRADRRRLHQPPPVHQTFAGAGFVVCSFVPRLYDFDPGRREGAVPPRQRRLRRGALLLGRRLHEPAGSGIGVGSISLHPAGSSTARSRAAVSAASRRTAPRRSR